MNLVYQFIDVKYIYNEKLNVDGFFQFLFLFLIFFLMHKERVSCSKIINLQRMKRKMNEKQTKKL